MKTSILLIFIFAISCLFVPACSKDVEIEELKLTPDSIEGILRNNDNRAYKAIYVEFRIYNSEGKMIYQQAEAFFNVEAKERREFSFDRYDHGGVRISIKRILKE